MDVGGGGENRKFKSFKETLAALCMSYHLLDMENNKHEMQSSTSSFVDDIRTFTTSVREGKNGLVNLLHRAYITDAKRKQVGDEVMRQAQTFDADVQKVAEAKMSYSEMRSLYG
jgi:hypothetical protein